MKVALSKRSKRIFRSWNLSNVEIPLHFLTLIHSSHIFPHLDPDFHFQMLPSKNCRKIINIIQIYLNKVWWSFPKWVKGFVHFITSQSLHNLRKAKNGLPRFISFNKGFWVWLCKVKLSKDYWTPLLQHSMWQGNKNTKNFCKAIDLIEDSHDKARVIKDQN